jgi:HK97 family phage prohead protease
MRELERRNFAQLVELRADPAGGLGTLHGYAAKFNVLSQNLGGFVERIDPGFFNKSLADNVRVLCRANHSDAGLLGTTEAGTLALSIDAVGLLYDNPLPDTTVGRDTSVLAKRGDLRYSSFAFYCIEDEWGFTEQGFPMRTLLQGQLVDVAPVNSPAYLDSTVAVRAFAESGLMTTPPKPAARALDPEDVNVLTQAMAWFTAVDSIVDEAQESIAAYLHVPSPDPDDVDDDAEPATDSAAQMPMPRSDPSPTEQRATHSAPASVLLRSLELDALK